MASESPSKERCSMRQRSKSFAIKVIKHVLLKTKIPLVKCNFHLVDGYVMSTGQSGCNNYNTEVALFIIH